MAMLASKSFPTMLGSQTPGMMTAPPQPTYQSARRAPIIPMATQNYASPPEQDFDDLEGADSVKDWDEDRVCEYLRSMKWGQYAEIFRKNCINGENLLELDKELLQEMGVEKVGDRVRLFLCIKKLRSKRSSNQSRRQRVRSSDVLT